MGYGLMNGVFQSWQRQADLRSHLAVLDVDIRDLDLTTTASGQLRLYATSGLNGGVIFFALGSNGALVGTQSRLHAQASMDTGKAALFGDQLFVSGGALQGLSQNQLKPQGAALTGAALGQRIRLLDEGSDLADDPSLMASFDRSGQLSLWQQGANGHISKAASATLADPSTISALEVVSDQLVLLAQVNQTAGGVQSFQLTASGLFAVDAIGIADGLSPATPSALQSLTAYGQSWAVLADAGSSSLSVLSVSAAGEMALVDQLSDTLATRFGGVTALSSVTVNGRALVVAAGDDGGVSLLELLPDGRLLHLASQALEASAEAGLLGPVTEIVAHASPQDGKLRVYLASQTLPGVAHLTVNLCNLGAAGTTGSATNDLLIGAATLTGGAGDDVLVANMGGGVLTGGSGADLFVASAAVGARSHLQIRDFTPDEDRLDVSGFADLRSLQALQVSARGSGLVLRHGDHVIEVQTTGSAALKLQDLFPEGWHDPHRLAPGQPWEEGMTYGSEAADKIWCGTEDDRVDGLGGDDRIGGNYGNDHLRGSAGNDTLYGSYGQDQLEGGVGADRMYGGPGHDQLEGGEGDDRMFGSSGNDTLRDSGGANRIGGGDGTDHVHGGRHADNLYGGTGHDQLWGYTGDDRIWGGDGDDQLQGHDGHDRLWGGAGQDVLIGGAGPDWLGGGTEDDVLSGEGDADVFIFADRHGTDRIQDFTPGEDLIDLSALTGIGGIGDLRLQSDQGDTLVTTGQGGIRLEGLIPSALDGDDFIF